MGVANVADLVAALLLTQFVAFPAALGFGLGQALLPRGEIGFRGREPLRQLVARGLLVGEGSRVFVAEREAKVLGVLHLVGLLLVGGSIRRLALVVSAFTVAHSITLAGATLGWVYAPQAPIEATIAQT